jgi:hypothetical protein
MTRSAVVLIIIFVILAYISLQVDSRRIQGKLHLQQQKPVKIPQKVLKEIIELVLTDTLLSRISISPNHTQPVYIQLNPMTQ